MTLSTKDQLEARISVGQIYPFEKLLKIMKSLGHTLYIESITGVTHIDYIKSSRYPRYVKIIEILERENQIWQMGEMIVSTHVAIEGVK
jgi:hypothetical protein